MILEIQKASLLKRFSAFLLDFILMSIAVTGFAALIGFITGLDGYFDTYAEKSAYYESTIQVDEQVDFSINFDISKENYDKLSEESRKKIDDAFAAFQKDEEVIYAYNMLFNLTLIILTFSTLLAYMLLEFVIPLIFGNGQTVGKKIFGIGIMYLNCVRAGNVAIFARAILGKYTIEFMVPLIIFLTMLFGGGGIVGLLVIILILFLEVFVFFKEQKHMLIHDALAHTVAVDLASQMIFDSEEDLRAYRTRLHEEAVQNAEY